MKNLTLFFFSLSLVTVGTIDILKRSLEPRFVERLVEVPVDRKSVDIKELVKTIPPKYGIDPLIIAAIVEKESGGRRDAIRFEPSQMARAAKITKNESQQRMYASSHCLLQVMGWHAPAYNLSWSDLYDAETCVEVGSKILADCMKKHEGKIKHEQIFRALQCYNGSEQYAREVYQRLADLLIERTL